MAKTEINTEGSYVRMDLLVPFCVCMFSKFICAVQ